MLDRLFELLPHTPFGEGIYLLIISMLPVIELRLAIPLGVTMDVPWYMAYPICVLGNIIPVPFLILFSRPIFSWMKRGFLKPLITRIEGRIKKNIPKVKKYRRLGLFLFVMLPLPGTGAWMGSLIAAFLNMRIKDALISIFGGVLVSGLIMTVISYGLMLI